MRYLRTATAILATVSMAFACNWLVGNEDGVFVDPSDGGVGPGPSDGGRDALSPIPGCEPTPDVDPSVLRDECGVFVFKTAGVDTNPGGRNAPVDTIQRGIELAVAHGKYRVYVCNADYELATNGDPIELADKRLGVTLIGGLRCANFNWAHEPGSRATIKGRQGTGPFMITITNPSRELIVADMNIEASPRSYGVLVSRDADAGAGVGPAVRFLRTTITTASGYAGGTSSAQPRQPEQSQGNPGIGTTGGAAKVCFCDTVFTSGGRGADQNVDNAMAGSGGGGGAKGTTGSPCTRGSDGADAGGEPAPAAGATRLGNLTSKAWVPESGQYGSRGNPGAGGGGGGAGTGGGSGGGGGGCGGCGGNAGSPGTGGQGSIGAAVYNSNVTFERCVLTTAAGGTGGGGGEGGEGLPGGDGGLGAGAGCRGGNGGGGGRGAMSGAGPGGISAGIVYVGPRPIVSPDTMIRTGDAGAGGPGVGANAGRAGISVEVVEIPDGGI